VNPVNPQAIPPLARPSAAHDGGEWNRCRSLRSSAVNNLPVTHCQPLLGQAPSIRYLFLGCGCNCIWLVYKASALDGCGDVGISNYFRRFICLKCYASYFRCTGLPGRTLSC
jgi:hypothetical protein